jgi:hypothetical protein
MQKGVVLGYMQDSLEDFGRTVNKKCLVTETSSNCCEVKEVDDDDDDDDDDNIQTSY